MGSECFNEVTLFGCDQIKPCPETLAEQGIERLCVGDGEWGEVVVKAWLFALNPKQEWLVDKSNGLVIG